MTWVLSEGQKQKRRRALAKRFEALDFVKFEAFWRNHRKQWDVDWMIKAIKMAKSGNYRTIDIARELDKSPAHVGMLFHRVEHVRQRTQAGWPKTEQKRTVIPEGAQLIRGETGEWRVQLPGQANEAVAA